ncbi:MAG: undecaprenyl-diphosphate phosphatase [Verrucomicrobiales bacterium]
MSIFEAIVIGLVQGITEFLPISSSAHIAIVGRLFDLPTQGLAMEVFLHLASVLVVIVFFYKEILTICRDFLVFLFQRKAEAKPGFLFGCYILVATVVTAVLGLLLLRSLGDAIKHPVLIGSALLLTALCLILVEKVFAYGNRTMEKMTWWDSLIIGLAQTLSVIPGISRSGATLVAALFCGLERETAVRYSFLLAIPVILGSSLLSLRDLTGEWGQQLGAIPLLVAFVVCIFATWIGIVWLIGFLKQGRLYIFAIYCVLLGLTAIFFL